MKRLTNKELAKAHIEGYWISSNKLKSISNTIPKVTFEELYCKCSQYEDAEEEIGIDLVTFVKVMTSDSIFGLAKDGYGKPVVFEYPMRDVTFNKEEKLLYVYCECDNDVYITYKIEDFGITWSLVREDLTKGGT